MHFSSVATKVLPAFLAASVAAQGPNTAAPLYPMDRTQNLNGTFFIVPVEDSALLQLTKPYPLAALPSSMFPNGYPAGKHPVLVWTGYINDIRQNIAGLPAYIDSLTSSSVLIPFVDRLGDGKSYFTQGVHGFIGGTDNQQTQGLVPALVGSLANGGYLLSEAKLDPDTAAWQPIGDNLFFQNTKDILVPQLISGPGIYPPAIDVQFSTTQDPFVTFETMKQILNQPVILPTGNCQRNGYWFNDTFANPIPRTGQVRLYTGSLPSQLGGSGSGSSVLYKGDGIGAWSADGQVIGFQSESCADASKNVIVP